MDGEPYTTAGEASCVLERFGTDFDQDGLADKLFGKLASAFDAPKQAEEGRLFDFQVSKEDPPHLGVFNLQWEEGTEVFSVGIAPSLGFPVRRETPTLVVTFESSDIDDATSPRVFEISGGLAAVALRVANNQTVVLTCPNDHVTTVTVGAVTN